MRTTILGLALLSAVSLTACSPGGGDVDPNGSNSETSANMCAVFPMGEPTLFKDVQEQIVEFGGSCVSFDNGERYTGVSENMTVYLNGKVLARDRWEVYDIRRIRVFGAYPFGPAKFSISYECTADKLVEDVVCGYVNENRPRQSNVRQ